jgi:hypothetical protein
MSLAYDLRYGAEALVILVNPMNVVAFPRYDQTKGRCCEYLPIGAAEYNEDGDILEMNAGSYDYDYASYSESELEKMIANYSLEEMQANGSISEALDKEDMQHIVADLKSLIKSRIHRI